MLGDLEHSKRRRGSRYCRRIKVEEVKGVIQCVGVEQPSQNGKILEEHRQGRSRVANIVV